MKVFLPFFILLFLIKISNASDSLSYSGRLVNANGSPVTGLVNLKFDLVYTNATSTILCTQQISSVSLTNGVFHTKLDPDCSASSSTLVSVLANVPVNEAVAIRVTDETHSKAYSFQALHSMPYSTIAKQLDKLGATTGQVLSWNGTKWAPVTPATGSGSVTSIATGAGLTGGPITATGTISIADGGVTDAKVASGLSRSKLAAGTANYVLINNGSGVMSEAAQLPVLLGGTGASSVAGARTNLGLGTAAVANIGTSVGNVMGSDAVPVCLAFEKLQMTAGPTYAWSCVADNDTADTTKLPLAGGTMTGALNMGTQLITNLATPTAAAHAATKAYVDGLASQWTTLSTNIYFNTANVGIGTTTPAEKLSVVGNVNVTGNLKLQSDNANVVNLKAPAGLAGSLTLNLPGTAGATGNALTTDGSGNLAWAPVATTASAVGGDLSGTIANAVIVSGAVTSAKIADGTIVDADVSGSAAIAQSKIANLTTDLSAKEGTITAGTSLQFWRGDKSWQTLNSAAVPEVTNLYFTEPRVLGTDLAGYSAGAGTITSADTLLSAIEKLSGNIAAVGSAATAQFVDVAGDTMSGALAMGNNKITGLATPTATTDAATKAYVDAQIGTASDWTKTVNDLSYSAGKVSVGTATAVATAALTVNGAISTNSTSLIIGDTTGNARGASSVDIQSSRSAVTQVAAGTDSIAVGMRNTVGGTLPGVALGYNNSAAASFFTGAVAVGVSNTSTGSGTVAVGNSNLSGNYDRGITIGGHNTINGHFGMAFGVSNTAGFNGIAFGQSNTAATNTIAIGKNISNSVANSLQIGHSDAGKLTILTTGELGIGTVSPTEKLHIVGNVNVTGDLKLKSDTANFVQLRAPTSLASTLSLIFPGTNGSSGNALVTDGSGNLSWAAVATTGSAVGGDLTGTIANAQIAAGAIVDADVAAGAAIAQSKIANLTTDLAAKEASITAGTTAQYWRGDKSWQTLNTTAVAEGSNLYFLDSRVRNALMSGYGVGTALPLAATDTLIEAIGKLEAQIIANDASSGDWSINGTNYYYNGGSVGIGTASPVANLEVSGASASSRVTNTSNSYYVDFGFPGSSGGEPSLSLYTSGVTNGRVLQRQNSTKNIYIGDIDANGGSIIFRTNGVDNMTIESNGNVGIGISSPAAKLEVAGQARTVTTGGIAKINASAAVDWNNGNAQSMSVACTATSFTNTLDAATYILAVTETGTTTCVFSQPGLTFYYNPANGARTSGQRTVYTFQRIGTDVYVSWIPGFQ